MSKFTPGPWAIDWNVARLDVFSGDGGTLIATLRRSALSAGIDRAARANARLIAAAPELYELLTECAEYIDCIPEGSAGGDDEARELAARAKKALAKVEAE